MEKRLELVQKALRKEDKANVLRVWNRYRKYWVGIGFVEYMTKEELLKYWEVTSRKITMEAKWNKYLYAWDSRKKYVILNSGYPISVGKFFCKDFVDIDDEEFLISLYNYWYDFGLDWSGKF